MAGILVSAEGDRQILKVGNVPIAFFDKISLGLDYGKGVVVVFDRDCHPSLIGYVLYVVYSCLWSAMAWDGEAEAIVVKSWGTGHQSGGVVKVGNLG